MSFEAFAPRLEELRSRHHGGADVVSELVTLRNEIKASMPDQLPPPPAMEILRAQAAVLREYLLLGDLAWPKGEDPVLDRQVEAWSPRLMCAPLIEEIDAFLDEYLRDVTCAESEAAELGSRLSRLQMELSLTKAYIELLGLLV